MINVAVIGYGYWGPNLVRNFNDNPSVNLCYVCDLDSNRLKGLEKRFPNTKPSKDYKEILKDDGINLVAISTPVSTHYKIASDVINACKHVLIEKPMTSKVSDAIRLIELAEKKGVKIFVDHTFIFTGAVKKIKELITSRVLGDIYYFDSVRVNLGLYQNDINVVWDLAPHDFAIMEHLISEEPESVSAIGAKRVHPEYHDISYITVRFKSGLIAHFHVNWLSPVKIRRIIIGGKAKMLVFDDLSPDEKIKVYDKGVRLIKESKDLMYKSIVEYRIGDMYAPTIQTTEALKTEVSHIVDCITNNKKPIVDGVSGLRVVKLLETAQKSLKKDGVFVSV